MFMRVNSKCAHQVRPPLTPDTAGPIVSPKRSRPLDSRTLAGSQAILLNAIDRVHSRARKLLSGHDSFVRFFHMDHWFSVIAASSELPADSVKN